jgi:SAM-dependent methyltransferase
VQDAIFAEPRLARIYDLWEGDRVDLPHYLAIAAELGAHSVLDVGCGTGNWACLLAERGFEVIGLDPAAASLDVARAKPAAQRVRWIHGDVTALPALAVDLATMTGNVSNVFLTQQEWLATLSGIHAALRPGGYLVFESMDPAVHPWRGRNRETTHIRRESPEEGAFESWAEVTGIDGDLVSIRRTYVFAADGATLTSDSTRRYPPRPVIEESLTSAGYELKDVRTAPDRPGLELVFIARKPAHAHPPPLRGADTRRGSTMIPKTKYRYRSTFPSSYPASTGTRAVPAPGTTKHPPAHALITRTTG